ncbi:MAG: cytochrome C oxidase subunit II [Bacteroidia bacterium]|nr:cytochrome C oxidase subunit II [Bacteroidia bacterium]
MVDSTDVLHGMVWVYTSYALAIISLMAWFGYQITRQGKGKAFKSGFFYAWMVFLIVTGVTLHIFTYNTIPWSPMDLNRSEIQADQVVTIGVADHKFILPEEKMVIKRGEKVLFSVTSHDLTYGFGVFRPDNSMVFQMQVVPGHPNEILWQFANPGTYTIRSTEYSGPKGVFMIEKDAILVLEN